jgi:glycine oxidase
VQTADVVIVGAGVIGASIAHALARASASRIVLVERGTPGCESSNAAAGLLPVASSRALGGALFTLRRASAAMFPELVAALEGETGIALGYRRDGLIAVAHSDSQAAELEQLVRHRRSSQGFRCELLTPADVRRLEPATNPGVVAGALFPDDAAINNEALVRALVVAAQRRGVEVRTGTAVRAVVPARDGAAIELEGERIDAPVVVVAAGAWSAALLAGAGIKVPVRPARGEMLAVCPSSWRLRHVLAAGDTYLVPRGDEILIGSTTAFAGFDARVSREGVARLRQLAALLVPTLNDTPVVRSWAGLRPCSTLRRPIIARLPEAAHVILATGHHRSGILLAPITATLVSEMVLGRSPSVPLAPFGYRKH